MQLNLKNYFLINYQGLTTAKTFKVIRVFESTKGHSKELNIFIKLYIKKYREE